MSALSRCLREFGQRSIELGTNVAHIFYNVSHYRALGKTLITHKAPESLFKMITLECTRYDTFYAKL